MTPTATKKGSRLYRYYASMDVIRNRATGAALFPSEQARLVRLLVERVTIGTEGIAVDLRNDGVAAIVRDMITPLKEQALA